jgi:hypothetical protein
MSFNGIMGMGLPLSPVTSGGGYQATAFSSIMGNTGDGGLTEPILAVFANSSSCQQKVFGIYLKRISTSLAAVGGQLTVCGVNQANFQVQYLSTYFFDFLFFI